MRISKRWTLTAATALIAILAMACGNNASDNPNASGSPAGGGGTSLLGAGSTFIEPAMSKWITDYKKDTSDVTINYQGIGSGGGIQQFTAKQVDFAASDAFLKDEEITAATQKWTCGQIHIPMVFGSVAIAFNVKGVTELTLDGPTLAKIYLGTIKTWDDAAIAALNPGVTLPSTAIAVAHRSDGSGTTNIFTTYLTSISPEWKTKVGAGKEIQWPTGIGGQGNDGVASAVQQNDGGIGYVELAYALNNNLKAASLKNADAKAVAPTVESTAAAAKSATIPDDLRFTVSNVGGDGYPIVGSSWVIASECGYTAAKADALKAFLHWALSSGDASATTLHYAPVTGDLETKANAAIDKINSKG